MLRIIKGNIIFLKIKIIKVKYKFFYILIFELFKIY
jgi:hypothetical protein